ncbi:hypothetical protein BVRB_003870 [Beta vulgaris subsp. vulgaris]|uniref:Uncharacterized protein n=1 Tax=Beta vulgaris subsp. vulgaris TaxID=3555 RepID=A0A0J8B7G2_BETVV|nr:hypothetical protein BVRB_003870 [Beta vulgaris subsp. vulgaris]
MFCTYTDIASPFVLYTWFLVFFLRNADFMLPLCVYPVLSFLYIGSIFPGPIGLCSYSLYY